MDVFVLMAKSAVAVMLLVAGGAKLADVESFAATVRLFVPRWVPRPARHVLASATALIEIAAGGASLLMPGVSWINLAVLALSLTFVAVSAAGLAFYQGRSCRCLGALSRRTFDLYGLLRSLGVGVLAAIATVAVRPTAISAGIGARVMLMISAAVLTLAAFTAARALAGARDPHPAPPGLAAR